MNSKPDTIKVSASHRDEIAATHADLFVTVKGSSVVSGDQAMKKAKEVSQLVEALTNFGLSPEAVHLQGVHIETSSGTLLKFSSATYRLRAQCEKLEQLPELLDIISSQKNTTLEQIDWKYPDDSAKEQTLEQAIAQAKIKAEKIAGSLGVQLLGVYDFIETTIDEEFPFRAMEMGTMQTARGATPAPPPSLSMEIQHNKTIHVNVDIWYRVSEIQKQ